MQALSGVGLPAAMLLLADSRLPVGAHAHSGGLAAAVDAGTVHDETTLSRFLAGRLHTTGLVAAAAAARASTIVLAGRADVAAALLALDRELDARTPSAAARAAARAQGRGLLRAGAAAWPSPTLGLVGDRPHAPLALGVVVVAAGGGAAAAAALSASTAVSGPASAAVRLLGLDPLGVTALLAALSPAVDAVAQQGAACADLAAELPAASAPLLDLLAQAHVRADVRLFAS
ncbi:MAG: urease accessory UreF family protein [Mycobacteriales bacterium]